MNLKIRLIDCTNWDYRLFDNINDAMTFLNINKCDIYMLIAMNKRCRILHNDIKYYVEFDDPRNESIAYKEASDTIYEKCAVCERVSLSTFKCCIPCYTELI